MKLSALYAVFEEKFPKTLACEWDNDGLMCASSLESEVKKVLCVLDVTKDVLEYAAANGYDTVISHHPMIFHHLGAVTPENHISERVIFALKNNINVFSYHTRADAAIGGVNDLLAGSLGLHDLSPFGDEEGDIGRIGELAEETDIFDFAASVKKALGCPTVTVAAAKRTVKRVAVLGGAGKSFIGAAKAAGADVFVSGELGFGNMTEAPEMGISLVEAGHFFTENMLCKYFSDILTSLGIENGYYSSNVISNI